jgi:hypothetical protein
MSALHVDWDRTARKEPHGYGFAGPLNSIDTPSNSIETGSVIRCGPPLNRTALIPWLTRRIDITVGRNQLACEGTSIGDFAA